MRLSKLAAISTVSAGCREVEKFGGAQSTRRTAAMASLNVGSDSLYHAAAFGRSAVAVSRTSASAHTVISENNPRSAGGGAQDRQIRPLPLRLHAKMGPHLLECGLHPPARDEPAEDGGGLRIEIGAEERGRPVRAGWVADQHPADRYGRNAGMMPQRRAGGDEQPALLGVVPLR